MKILNVVGHFLAQFNSSGPGLTVMATDLVPLHRVHYGYGR